MQEILMKIDILNENYQKKLKFELEFFLCTQSFYMEKIRKDRRDL